MGIWVSHDCWWGSCYAYHRFSVAIARAAGTSMAAIFRGERIKDDIQWLIKTDPTCGTMGPNRAKLVAVRLRELADKLPLDKREDIDNPNWMRESAIQFAQGLETAAQRNERVRFEY